MVKGTDKKIDLTISIVTYNNEDIIKKTLTRIFNLIDKKVNYEVFIVDNNSDDKTTQIIKKHFKKLMLIESNENVGYGSAHNICIKKGEGKYHLILNPDIFIKKGTIKALIEFMNKNKNVGIVSPKVLNSDGSVQYLCKRYPAFYDIIIRFLFSNKLKFLFEKRLKYYTMYESGYNKIMDVENLTGAFMFIRKSILKKCGLFDENLFLYFEDTDLARRAAEYSEVVFYPYTDVIHLWQKKHYKNLKLFFIYIKSLIYYFNKWGWKIF